MTRSIKLATEACKRIKTTKRQKQVSKTIIKHWKNHLKEVSER